MSLIVTCNKESIIIIKLIIKGTINSPVFARLAVLYITQFGFMHRTHVKFLFGMFFFLYWYQQSFNNISANLHKTLINDPSKPHLFHPLVRTVAKSVQ